jgi:hypothetical protein
MIAIKSGDYESAQMDITDIYGNVVRVIPMLFTPTYSFVINTVDDEADFDDLSSVVGNTIFVAKISNSNKRKGYFDVTEIKIDELFGFKYKSITFYRVD